MLHPQHHDSMNKQIVTFFIAGFCFSVVKAQTQFILKGKIEFEKTTNLYRQIDAIEEDETFRGMIKKSMPQSKSSYFDLYFNGNKTIYMPGREVVVAQKVPDFIEGPASDNVVYTDLEQQSFTSQKTVFDNVFNITDSVRKIKWKITADKRTVAGLECRKATAIIMDSVFVVAFYSEQIVTPGGPESFAGLPGMILGLAIPRLNTTWFATKLEMVEVKDATLTAPKKGKKTSITSLMQQLNSAMKNWGKWRDKNIWQIMI